MSFLKNGFRSLAVFLMAGAVGVGGGQKRVAPNEAGNDNLEITANPIIDRDQLRTALGEEMPVGIIAVEVRLVPKGDGTVSISRDDFTLLSHRDGQRSGPYAPSQIAGSTVMVLNRQSVGGGVGGQSNGPSWGSGIPGLGRPRMGSGDGGGIGNTASNETKTTTETKEEKTKNSPLLKALADHMLPDAEIKEPVKGLLYFPLEGKVRTKDLELIYKGPAGRLLIDFH